MITHIVMFKLQPEHRGDAEKIRDLLMSLPPKVEQIRHFEVCVDVVRAERSWDMALYSRFDSLEDLQAYQVHPEHVAVAGFIKERMFSSASVDAES